MTGPHRRTSRTRRRPVLRAPAGLLAAVLLAACGQGGSPSGVPAARAQATGVPPGLAADPSGDADERSGPAPAAPATGSAPATRPARPTGTARPPAPDPAGPRTPPVPAPAATGRTKGPDLSRPPSRSPSPSTAPKRAAAGPAPKPGRAVLRIGDWSSYVMRGGQDEVDACRDAVQWTGPEIGTEDGYEMSTVVIVGHDYCNGFDRFATLPKGTRITLSTVHGTWTYEVYASYLTPGRGAPAAGLYWGDLTLQSCVGPDTGFSYLVRL
ncbi:hypothetical protein ACWD5R_02400 [Streptomyces sp. NPDC002514]|uniref:hypothetical protein n=1 Tax=Streptomyces sp. NPDC001270 TaxID=3364554 RepID=UPI0036BDC09A